jgi:DNA modification methylase
MSMQTKLIHSDCLEALKNLPDNSVDSVVTDPPYGLSFMGKKWDYDVPSEEIWAECLRVLKPGGHLLAFAGTRTQHRMAVRIEDAGFEIRDMIAWVYGSGFPKSLDVSKAIDKAAGAERATVKVKPRAETSGTMAGASDSRPWIEKSRELGYHEIADKNPVTAAAAAWQGWGTALKPALEPITVARKPLIGTVAENVLAHGTGAINVDGCRVGDTVETWPKSRSYGGGTEYAFTHTSGGVINSQPTGAAPAGRWPANLIHDGSEEPAALLGDAARFFYCAKASKRDRDEGLEGFEAKARPTMGSGKPSSIEQSRGPCAPRANNHPTVKPTDLMRYLCRLVTPPNGTVLDPFMGSGSTGKAAMLEGFNFIGIEREAEYIEIAKARINWTLLC